MFSDLFCGGYVLDYLLGMISKIICVGVDVLDYIIGMIYETFLVV